MLKGQTRNKTKIELNLKLYLTKKEKYGQTGKKDTLKITTKLLKLKAD